MDVDVYEGGYVMWCVDFIYVSVSIHTDVRPNEIKKWAIWPHVAKGKSKKNSEVIY